MTSEKKATLELGIGRIPEILLDATGHDCTSPFTFTGNHFEFRVAGSLASCAAVMTAINTTIANRLNEFKASVGRLMEEDISKDGAIFRILKENIIASEPIRSEEDGYSEEWKREATHRGLINICHVPKALMRYMDNQSRTISVGKCIFNETGLTCRLEVEFGGYTMRVQIESRVLNGSTINHIVPIVISYQNRLLEGPYRMKEIFPAEEYEVISTGRKGLVKEISYRVSTTKVLIRDMAEVRKVADHKESFEEKVSAYEETVRPYLESIRDHTDHLKMEVDNETRLLSKYRELLFTR